MNSNKKNSMTPFLGGLILFSTLLFSPSVFAESKIAAPGTIECKMAFNFKSWSAFFHSGKGEGTISCNNGKKMDATLSSKGGSVFDFGKSDIINGHGKFSPVSNVQELFGSYSATGGEIGAGKSATGLSLSKTKGGMVNLDLSGTGAGVEIGFNFSDFKITPKE